MKHTSPTLLVIAALAIVPGLSALDVKDDDVKLGLAIQLQIRADVSDAHKADKAESPYDVMTGNSNGGDPADFYLRRARFGLKGTWRGDYKFALIMSGDKAQAKDKAIGIYEAYVERVWKDESHGMTHELKAGQSNAFFNGVAGSFSSSGFLFAGARATDQLLASRGNGLGYALTTPMVKFGADVQNNTKDDTSATAGDGMFYSARVEVTGPGEWAIAKPVESFVGKAGKGVLVSFDAGENNRAGNVTTTTGWGTELLAHVDGLTALAEYRADKGDNKTNNTLDYKASVWLVQAGYALPLGDAFIEPAVRYQKIDTNKDNTTEGNSYGTNLDYGTSGSEIDFGVNYYIHEHKNKVQLSYSMWKGEESKVGGYQAEANILRAQWQLAF